MKTDKEFLELAAKAAGVECDDVGPFVEFKEWQSEFGMNIGGSFELVRRNWEPLTDDGDALRLAVKLGIDIDFSYGDIAEKEVCTAINMNCDSFIERLTCDPCAATRRAIVRAAAAIGEKL